MKYHPSIIGQTVVITMDGPCKGKTVKVLDCSSWVADCALTTSRFWWKFWATEHWDWKYLERTRQI